MAKHPIGTGVLAPKPTRLLKVPAGAPTVGTSANPFADLPDNPSSPTTPKPPRKSPVPSKPAKVARKAPVTKPRKSPVPKAPKSLALVAPAGAPSPIAATPQPDPLSQYPGVQAPLPTPHFAPAPKPSTGGGLVAAIGGVPVVGSITHAATGLAHGAAHGLSSAAGVAGSTLKNFSHEALELPQNMATGLYNIAAHPKNDLHALEQLPMSLANSYAYQHGGVIGGHAAQPGLIQNIEKTDPIIQTIEGHPKALEQNPLQALLDVSGAGKALDAGAGAVARSGALGQTLKEAAARTPLRTVVVPAVDQDGNLRASVVANSPDDATATQSMKISPGLLQGAVQKATLKRPKLATKLANAKEIVGHPARTLYNVASGHGLNTAQEQAMLHAADVHMSSASNARQAALGHAAHEIVKARPKDEDAANLVPHYIMGTPQDPDAAREMLSQRLAGYKQALDQHDRADAAMKLVNQGDYVDAQQYRDLLTKPAASELDKAMMGEPFKPVKIQESLSQHILPPQQLAENRANREYLTQGLKSPDFDQSVEAGTKLQDLQKAITEQQRDRGLMSAGAAERAPLLQAAHANGLPVQRVENLPTRESLIAKQAQKDLVQAQREYRDARITKAGAKTLEAKKDQLQDARANYNNLKDHLNKKYTGHAIADDSAPKEMRGLRPVGNEELQEKLDALGVPRSEYFNTGTNEDPGAAAYSATRNSRGDTPSSHLTGANIQRGAFAGGYSGAARSILHGVSRIESAKEWDGFIKQFGHTPSWGDKSYNKFNVRQDQQALEKATGMKWTAVKTRAQGVTPEQMTAAAEHQKRGGSYFEADTQAAKNQRVDTNHMADVAPEENLALVPDKVLARREQHYAARKPTFLSHLNNYFRTAVLPFSPKYYGSVLGEGAGRGLVNGMHPGNYLQDYRAGTRLPQALRNAGYHDEAEHIEGITGLGSHMSMQTRDIQNEINTMHRAGTEPSSALKAAASKAGQTYRQIATAPMKGAAWLEKAQTHIVVGHAVRQDIKQLTGHMSSAMLGASKYMDQIAHGYAADSSKALQISDQIDKVLGQYNHYSPQEQSFIRKIAPFWPWYKNALQFVYVTMPHDHPLLTAVLNEAGQANASAWAQSHRGLPGTNEFGVNYSDLLSDVSTAPGAYQDWMRFLPMGIASTPPVEIVPNVSFPTLSGGALALTGESPFYTPLKGSGKYGDVDAFSTQALGDALKATAESVVPYNAVHRIAEGASSGGWKGALSAAVNPVPTTHYNVKGSSSTPFAPVKISGSSGGTPFAPVKIGGG